MNPAGAVLILEDDVDVRRAARIALTPHVDRVEERAAPDDLEATLAQTTFDAVLLDMNFVHGARDGSEGLDTLGRIRASDPALAVVLMTAYGGVSLAVNALKQGAADFVLKPWRNDKLIAAVTAATSLTRAQRAAGNLDLDAIERNAIQRALALHGGNISTAASALGLSRAALYRRISKHGL